MNDRLNTIESYSITSPYNQTDTCAKFVIDDLTSQYILSNIANVGSEYTLSFWIRSETTGSITVCGETISTTTVWSQHIITFTANSVDVAIQFNTVGTYFVYHSQLELGNTPSDWRPAPEDTSEDISDVKSTADVTAERMTVVETQVRQLSDSISTLVRDADGQSLMTQTADGWVFSTSSIDESISGISSDLNDLQETTGSTAETVSNLQKSVDELGALAEYVKISTHTEYRWDRYTISTTDGYVGYLLEESEGSGDEYTSKPYNGQIYATINLNTVTGVITLSEPFNSSESVSNNIATNNYTNYPYCYHKDTGDICKLIDFEMHSTTPYWQYVIINSVFSGSRGEHIETVSSPLPDTYPDDGPSVGYWYTALGEVVEPCIELGEGDSDFKLLITNTQIIFQEGTDVPAYISNQSLHIQKAVVDVELRQGGFVWNIRSNGNMGLLWKG